MKDLFGWISTLLSHWQYWISGGGFGGLVVIAAGMYERFRGRTMSSGNYILIFIVCFLVGASFMAWRDEHKALVDEHKVRLEVETIRPYVLIEELPPGQIRARAMADSRNVVLPEGGYERGYIFGQAPNGEILIYNYRNSGKIPAKNIAHYQKVIVFDENGNETAVPISSPTNIKGALLYPDQYATYAVTLPPGTVFTGSPVVGGTVRIVLVMTYVGRDSDRNTYFYKVVLKAGRYNHPEDMNRTGIGGLNVESMDEGIMKELNQLLR